MPDLRIQQANSQLGRLGTKPGFSLNRTEALEKAHTAASAVAQPVEGAAYIKVVGQGLWSGRVAGGEAVVVLGDVSVGQKLLYFSSGVRQLTSDGAELL